MISYISENLSFVCLVLRKICPEIQTAVQQADLRIKPVKACCVWLQPRCLEFLHPKGRAIIRSVRMGQELKLL